MARRAAPQDARRGSALTERLAADIDAEDFDCLRCGACCFTGDETYIRLFTIDQRRLSVEATGLTWSSGGKVYLRLAEGHCSALSLDPAKGHYACRIYEARPDACRGLVPGSGECRAHRAEKRALARQAIEVR